ncbi:hypothetical protein TYRP_020551 [Tyrophagus putrescentiae]|nr:hypothetical protein TYRP_020551 [Tyrophagus putrescentiae]
MFRLTAPPSITGKRNFILFLFPLFEILRLKANVLRPYPLLLIRPHPKAQHQKEAKADGRVGRRQVEQHDGRRLEGLPEDQRRDDANDGGEGDKEGPDAVRQHQVHLGEGEHARPGGAVAEAEEGRAAVDERQAVAVAEEEHRQGGQLEDVVVAEDEVDGQLQGDQGVQQAASGEGGGEDRLDVGRLGGRQMDATEVLVHAAAVADEAALAGDVRPHGHGDEQQLQRAVRNGGGVECSAAGGGGGGDLVGGHCGGQCARRKVRKGKGVDSIGGGQQMVGIGGAVVRLSVEEGRDDQGRDEGAHAVHELQGLEESAARRRVGGPDLAQPDGLSRVPGPSAEASHGDGPKGDVQVAQKGNGSKEERQAEEGDGENQLTRKKAVAQKNANVDVGDAIEGDVKDEAQVDHRRADHVEGDAIAKVVHKDEHGVEEVQGAGQLRGGGLEGNSSTSSTSRSESSTPPPPPPPSKRSRGRRARLSKSVGAFGDEEEEEEEEEDRRKADQRRFTVTRTVFRPIKATVVGMPKTPTTPPNCEATYSESSISVRKASRTRLKRKSTTDEHKGPEKKKVPRLRQSAA